MKKIFTLLLLYLALSFYSNATIRRVGYIGTIQGINGLDYSSLLSAHDASLAGDTIQLYPSTTGGGSYTATITKQLVLIGPGYFTNGYTLNTGEIPNNNLQNFAGFITACNLVLDNGSSGTIIQGVNGLTITTATITNPINNISISKCRNVNLSFINSANCDGWKVSQCYGLTILQNLPGGSFTGDRTITNLTISNSVIFSSIGISTSPSGSYTGNKIYNCNFLSGSSLSLNGASFLIQNCIFEGQNFSGVNNVVFTKNITNQTSASNPINSNPGSSGNVFNVSIPNLFVGYVTNQTNSSFSNDGRFKLSTINGNPAVNGGFVPGTTTPTDCGIYGGPNPYVLSGIPSIPVYYQLGAPTVFTMGQTYTVTFSIKSN